MAEKFAVTRLPGFATIAVVAFVALYAPILTLVGYSFNASESAAAWTGFTLDWYRLAFQNDEVKSAALNSLIVATAAAMIGFASLLMGAFTRFGLWRLVVASVLLLLAVQALQTYCLSVGNKMAGGWVLAYVAPAVGMVVAVAQLWLTQRPRRVPKPEVLA